MCCCVFIIETICVFFFVIFALFAAQTQLHLFVLEILCNNDLGRIVKTSIMELFGMSLHFINSQEKKTPMLIITTQSRVGLAEWRLRFFLF